MKKVMVLATVLMILFLAQVGSAASITVRWDAVANATGYKIDQSINLGVAWTEIKDAGNVTTTTVVVPDTGLVLLRAKAYNAQGTEIRTNAGAWYNGLWTLPASPQATGVQ